MVYVLHITLLLATIVLADYYVDNANTSVLYSMAPSQSGQGWQNFSVGSQSLALSISNSTGNYTIPLDASHCYDENYALGVCGTNDDCFVQIPFTGSGITMYVFNAGMSGMTASFAIDGGNAVSNSINAPPAPTYQVSNVSLYDIQGLASKNHTMVMTILDWDGSATSMKFDYAYVNETFVAAPATTSSTPPMASTSTSQVSSQTPSQTSAANSSTSNKTNVGAIIGGTLGGVFVLAGIVIGFLYFRKRKAQPQSVFPPPTSTFQVNPFTSEYRNSPTPPRGPLFTRHPDANLIVPPLTRSAILRDALAAGTQPSSEPLQGSQSLRSGMSSPAFQPLRRRRSSITDTDLPPLNASHLADRGSPFSDPRTAPGYNLTTEQLEVIDRLRADNVPADTIARVIGGFVTSQFLAGESGSARVTRDGSIISALPPPSYQTQDR